MTTSLSQALVVFDLDGTLVDTAPDLIDTLNVILAREGLAPVPFETAREMIGGGARVLIERGLETACRDCGLDEVDRLYDDFVAHYAAHIAERSRPFPGVEATMDALAADGYRLAVCTNKLEGLSLRLLDALGLTSRFAAICGQDTFAIAKPNAAFLLKTIARAGGAAERTVMVGDSAADIDVARAAGVPVVGVTFGYTQKPVAELGPDRVISHFSQLPAAVGALLGTNGLGH